MPWLAKEDSLVAHLDAAYNLARWLTGDDRDAEDVVQEAYARAFQARGQLRDQARPWLLAIVRNTTYSWLKKNRGRPSEPFDESIHSPELTDPESAMIARADRDRLVAAIEQVPAIFREVFVLRELEELTYEEIAHVIDAPIGTVMSRLSRARKKIAEVLEHGT